MSVPQTEEERCCTSCSKVKPCVEFHRNGRTNLKTCNACSLYFAASRRTRLGYTEVGGAQYKKCKKCNETKPAAAFRCGEIRYSLCVDCRKENSRKGSVARREAREGPRMLKLYPGWGGLNFDGLKGADPRVFPFNPGIDGEVTA